MRTQEIREQMRVSPFEPFRIHLSDGTHHDVRHPEMAALSERRLFVVTDLGLGEQPDRIVHCDPLHIIKLETLEQTDASRP